MKIGLFNEDRVGLVTEDEKGIIDATGVLPAHDPGFGAGFWVRMCRDFEQLRPAFEQRLATGEPQPIDGVVLKAPVLNPTKVIAAAANYTEHVEEMRPRGLPASMLDFDVFLKSPSSIVGPEATVHLPEVDAEIHYEGELALVVGKPGRHIDPANALDHILGWTILLDITERGTGDRSRRKSHDGFTPIGPWMVTHDEIADWRDLRIRLELNGEVRQDVRAGEMIVDVPGIIAAASRVMTLSPGDVITTGAPPGVGEIRPGDRVEVEVTGLSRLAINVDR